MRLLQNGFRIKDFSSNSDFILIFVRNDKQFLSFRAVFEEKSEKSFNLQQLRIREEELKGVG